VSPADEQSKEEFAMSAEQPAHQHRPVTDWATDFDHTDPEWAANPFPIWEELRSSCPLSHTERFGGAWLPATHELVSTIAYDTENYTSRAVVVSEARPGPNDLPAPIGVAPPITSDPPFHHMARRLLLPAFAPKKIEALTDSTVAICEELLDEIAHMDAPDAAVHYSQHIPVRVIAHMLGFPASDADIFRHIIHVVIEEGVRTEADDEGRIAEAQAIDAYFDAQIADHVAHPRDDLTNFLLNARLDGQPLAHEHVRGTMILLLVAGIDTTWSAIGAALWHLGQRPDHRRQLVEHPDIWPFAIEEFLRAYAPVTMGRLVAKDHTLDGHELHEGDWVLLPFPAANRDPKFLADADQVILDRPENRHSAFGLGIHRCIGSNLARMEMTVALQRWMARYPDFSLADPAAVTWSTGQVRGPRSIPVRLHSVHPHPAP
jgi:cytochrome P450